MSEKATERDFATHPYSPDEERVAAWLRNRIPDVGTGDDPIGFVLASYELLHMEKVRLEGILLKLKKVLGIDR